MLCGTARADLSFTNSATVATWNQEGGQNPFYSTSLSGLTGQGVPAAGSGATNEILSETFTITNGAGSLAVGTTNYLLTGISFISSAGSSGIRIHLYDVTTNLTSNNGTPLQGSGASYALMTGDLLGGGGGLFYSNNLTSEQQVNISLSTGTNTDDQIVLGTNHTYALEFSVPVVGGSFHCGIAAPVADPGREGFMASGNEESGHAQNHHSQRRFGRRRSAHVCHGSLWNGHQRRPDRQQQHQPRPSAKLRD